jgi:hypothetical protein
MLPGHYNLAKLEIKKYLCTMQQKKENHELQSFISDLKLISV